MLLAAVIAGALALAPLPRPQDGTSHARGTFEVVMTPLPADSGDASGYGRMRLVKRFDGAMAGTATGEMLAMMGGSESGAYVAMERLEVVLDGRSGSFVLGHKGVMDGGVQDVSITIVPGSGAGELSGIRGVFHLDIEDGGQHRYDLEYTLPEAPGGAANADQPSWPGRERPLP